MKAHLAYLTATRYLFGEKQQINEAETIEKEPVRMTRLEMAVRHLEGVKRALGLLAVRLSRTKDDLQRGL